MHNSGLHSKHWFALTAALVSVGFGGFQCQNQPFISVGNLDCLSNPPKADRLRLDLRPLI